MRPASWLPVVSLSALVVACGPPEPVFAPHPEAQPAAPTASAAPAAAAPPEGAACPGKVEVADGLQEVEDRALLAQAVGDPGKGKLCAGKVFAAVKPVTVYRVWNGAKAYTQLGSWWSFARPAGPVDAYRAANAICPEWSELNSVSQCRLKVGARVVVGPGQSASCDNKVAYPASATNQVFIPNETRDPANQKVFVEGCSAGAAWP